jgi:chemotaxis response regulator CheB
MAKVLIVDDDAFFRRMLHQFFLCEPDFEVCGEAENGKEAVEKALAFQPDLVVLDVLMPVMNGIDAARVLRLMMPTLPLVLNSAAVDPLTEQQARTIGISEIVPKSAELLIQKARRILCRENQAAA